MSVSVSRISAALEQLQPIPNRYYLPARFHICALEQEAELLKNCMLDNLVNEKLPVTKRADLMDFILQPWHLYLVILAGCVNRQQHELIDYLITENRVLKEKLGKKRILLSDAQRRRLAVKGRVLDRKRLMEVGTLFTPDTILRWHRQLVAKKWDYSDRRKSVDRPRIRSARAASSLIGMKAIIRENGRLRSEAGFGPARPTLLTYRADAPTGETTSVNTMVPNSKQSMMRDE